MVSDETKPVSIGVITDVQYANKPDVYIEYVGKLRLYSKVLSKTSSSINFINQHGVSALLHLGDIIDGNETLTKTQDDLSEVLEAFDKSKAPLWHVIGNHCLDAGRPYLLDRLKLNEAYYSRDLADWRVIVLDTVEVSVHRADNTELAEQAKEFLKRNSSLPNAKEWNGGMSSRQKSWLRDTLSDAAKRRMKSIVCGHLPLVANNHFQEHVMWESQWLVDLFTEYNHVVKAYFAGHFHEGGYVLRNGVHYVTYESVLDSESPEGSAGVVGLWQDRIEITGYGDMTSRTLLFK